MWPSFANMLSWWQWTILASIPPAIILLYFLKLKRRPLEVPSTYLWHKSIEDLHVNSIWQRLRRNLLLFLQLLLLLLVALALMRPHWQKRALIGDRFIFLIDNSASMGATDVEPSRLAVAKRQVGELIDQMSSGDVAMLVSFADTARVEQSFTDNRRRLRLALQDIKPTQRPTSLLEALRVASGLANPGHIAEDTSDLQVAEALPAELYIYSDGRFGPTSGFSLGNLEPHFISIGEPDATNVGITAFSVRRSEADPELFQAFARLKNFSDQPVDVSMELSLDGRLIDADQLDLDAEEARGVAFDLGAVETGVLKLAATTGDDLSTDDVAWTVITPPHPADVLLITPGNEPLELALQTDAVRQIAELTIEGPEFLKSKGYEAAVVERRYDLIIFDCCGPEEKGKMPRANTLWIGQLPPVEGWSAGAKVDVPQIIDVDTAHPLMQWIDLGDVLLLSGTPLETPSGGSVLIDSDVGPMAAIAPREQFEDAVLAFAIVDRVDGEIYVGTNWHSRQSFPVFLLNVLDYLGGGRNRLNTEAVRPGHPVRLEFPAGQDSLRVAGPSGKSAKLRKGREDTLSFTDTGELGVYRVESGGKPRQPFAVNLFDLAESEIRPKQKIQVGWVPLAGQSGWETAREEIWKGLLLLGLAVLLFEWYIYTRRVSL